MNTTKLVETYRRTNKVQRLAGHRILQYYSVAEHQANAAMLYVMYCKEMKEDVDGKLLSFILTHDILEVYTGDLLYPAKHAAPLDWEKVEYAIVKRLKEEQGVDLDDYTDSTLIDKEDIEIWRLCDMTELYCFCRDETSLGNSTKELREVMSTAFNVVLRTGNIFFITLMQEYDH
jgi:5'-deoxynucleotidase YfbR-like HD superfamily hydrolase